MAGHFSLISSPASWTRLACYRRKGLAMGLPNKAEIKGKIKKAKGTVKENVGHAVGNRRMENQGAADRRKGDVQETLGKARRKVGDAVKDVGKALRK
jgi:uncharacterized protein YjbJ (UPF0337 family)